MLSQLVRFRRQGLMTVLIGVALSCASLYGLAEETAQRTAYTAPSLAGNKGLAVIGPTANEALEQKADLLMVHQEYISAIHVYESVTSPTAEVLNKTGIAYEKMRMFAQAKADFEQAMAASPKFRGPSNNLGTVYYAEGDLAKAEKFYKKALKQDPRNASVYSNLGTLYFTRRKMHKGVEAYQQALSLDPEVFQRSAVNGIQADGTKESVALINFYLAETCAQAGMKVAAMAYLRRAVSAGFHDEVKVREDRNFASLRGMPEFQDLFSVETAKP